MPIYTKKGDKGMTKSLFGPMSKSDALAEALGSIDELNSWIGLVRGQIFNYQLSITKLDLELKQIQNNLLIIGSGLAGSKKKIKSTEVRRLERLVDKLTAEMPQLANFIYPVGQLQVARAVSRRAEREIVRYMNYAMPAGRQDLRFMNKTVLKYMNRLSDALFTMARWTNFELGIKEEVWK